MPRKNFIDMTGQRFGTLTVIERSDNAADGTARWLVRCDCGAEKVKIGKDLRLGMAKSCRSCAKRTHGMSRTRIYECWHSMATRAKGTGNQYQRKLYADINVCDEWLTFEPFRDWAMANGYADNLTLDRIDNSKGYSPDNCRWATSAQQARNTRRTVLNTELVCEMREEFNSGKRVFEIAADRKLNYFTVYNAVKDQTRWKGI